MELYAAIAKHGVAVIIGFLVGLVAIAVIEPITVNGRVLLMLTTIAVCALIGEAVLYAIRRRRGRRPRKSGSTATGPRPS